MDMPWNVLAGYRTENACTESAQNPCILAISCHGISTSVGGGSPTMRLTHPQCDRDPQCYAQSIHGLLYAVGQLLCMHQLCYAQSIHGLLYAVGQAHAVCAILVRHAVECIPTA